MTPNVQVDPVKLRSGKDEALRELLRTHHSVYVHFDSRRAGVLVPEQLRGNPQLSLVLGLNLPVPVKDLLIDNKGWSAKLSFNQAPYNVFVPWEAVYLIVGDSGVGINYPSDTPTEAKVNKTQDMSKHEPIPVDRKKTLPVGWRVIEGGKKSGDKAPD